MSDVESSNTRLQVEQMPEVEYIKIISYGSISSGYLRNTFNRSNPVPTNQSISK